MSNLENRIVTKDAIKERDDTLSKCDAIISNNSVAIKDAVEKARVQEQQHYSI